MLETTLCPVAAAADYIENHLQEKLNLETIAQAAHYSKYHLHRLFADTLGLTVHDYVKRRRLTEAARQLAGSSRPVLEIALTAGYGSQQSFADAFKAMYKVSPGRYRAEKAFYPLQLGYALWDNPKVSGEERDWQRNIVFAKEEDIPAWLALLPLIVDGFPCLNEAHYRKELQRAVRARQALILKDVSAHRAIGVMVFRETAGSIDFLGIHPRYRKKGIAKAFCQKALLELASTPAVTVTTFREGDKADTGYRKMFQNLGFVKGELLEEFGYPTQRLILYQEQGEGRRHE